MENMTGNWLDAKAMIALHGRSAIALLTSRIEALLRDGDEVGAMETDEVLQAVEKHFELRA